MLYSFEFDLVVNNPIDSYYVDVDLPGLGMDSCGMTEQHLAADNHEPGCDVPLDVGVRVK